MNPILQSILTTIGASAAASVATWAASVGIVPQSDVSTIENALVAAGLYGIAGVLAWLKAMEHTQKAQIDAVNEASNGVKVVAQTAQAVQVDGPIGQTGGLGMRK